MRCMAELCSVKQEEFNFCKAIGERSGKATSIELVRAFGILEEPSSDDFRRWAWEASSITARVSSARKGHFFSSATAGFLWWFLMPPLYISEENMAESTKPTLPYSGSFNLEFSEKTKSNLTCCEYFLVFFGGGGAFSDLYSDRGRCRARAEARHDCWLLRSKLLAGFTINADSGNHRRWHWNQNGPSFTVWIATQQIWKKYNKKKKTKENNTSFSDSRQIRSKGWNGEERQPHMTADWITIPAMPQLNHQNGPTRALISLVPSVSLSTSLLTLQIGVQEECNQESFLSAPGINPAVSQLWDSIDLCRRNVVLLSRAPLSCGSAVWKLCFHRSLFQMSSRGLKSIL